MEHAFWNNWYLGWGWFLWLGFFILMFASLGNWGYTYRAHQRFGDEPRANALDILDARYARGDITHDEYARIKSEIGSTGSSAGQVANA